MKASAAALRLKEVLRAPVRGGDVVPPRASVAEGSRSSIHGALYLWCQDEDPCPSGPPPARLRHSRCSSEC